MCASMSVCTKQAVGADPIPMPIWPLLGRRTGARFGNIDVVVVIWLPLPTLQLADLLLEPLVLLPRRLELFRRVGLVVALALSIARSAAIPS